MSGQKQAPVFDIRQATVVIDWTRDENGNVVLDEDGNKVGPSLIHSGKTWGILMRNDLVNVTISGGYFTTLAKDAADGTTATATDGLVFMYTNVKANSKLVINDGVFTSHGGSASATLHVKTGTNVVDVTINGGTFTDASKKGWNVRINTPGTVTINDGEFIGTAASGQAISYEAGTLNIWDGTFAGYRAIAVKATGTLNVYGGTFKAPLDTANGNVIYFDVTGAGKLNIYGGTYAEIKGSTNAIKSAVAATITIGGTYTKKDGTS
jgi:hypothetical protein